MTQPPFRIAGAFRAVGYLVLSWVAMLSFVDMAATLAPFLPKLVAWRLQAEGLTANAWTMPALMVLLLCFLAFALEDRKVLLVLCGAAALFTFLLIATSAMFALDAIEMNRSVPAAGKTTYAVSAALAMSKLGFGVLSFAVLSWSAARAARALKKAPAGSQSRQPVFVPAAGVPAK
jgi:hypothetical protein